MRRLVGEIGNGNHGQRECGEKIMGFGRKDAGSDVPGEEQHDACERDHAKDRRQGSSAPVKTNVHGPLLPSLTKETMKIRAIPECREALPYAGCRPSHCDST